MLVYKEFPLADTSLYEGISEKTICFDIETTGLNKKFSHITVIGTGFVRENKIIFRQWLLDDPSKEKTVLAEFSNYLKNFQIIIQFNGNSFDIPFVIERCKMYDIKDPFAGMEIIDIYKSLKHLPKSACLDNLKQKSLEKLFNFKRRDRISGYECILAYNDYITRKSDEAKSALLLHNEDDVLGLLKTASIHNLDTLDRDAELIGCKADKEISFKFKLNKAMPILIKHDEKYVSVIIKNNMGILKLHPDFSEKKIFFDNCKDYYYLPDEDRAIHKSIGMFVDRSHRRKATRSNCYEKLESFFFIQYEEFIRPSFREKQTDKILWFRGKDFTEASDADIYGLFISHISKIFGL